MVSRKATPKRRRGPQSKSTTRVIAEKEACELADKWGLSGQVREAFVRELPAVTETRRGNEAGLKSLPTPKQLRREIADVEKLLRALKEILKRRPSHAVGVLVSEATIPLIYDDPAVGAETARHVARSMREIHELMHPLAQKALRRIDQQIANDKAQQLHQRRSQGRLFQESAPGYQMRRLGSNRARPQDGVLAEWAVKFHASWVPRTKVSREKFCWEVLDRAGVAQGSIEALVDQVSKVVGGK